MSKEAPKPLSKEAIDQMSQAVKERFAEQRRSLDRQIMHITTDANMVRNEMKLAARKGDEDCVRILARALVQAEHGKRHLEKMKANLQALTMSMQQALSQARVVGVLDSVSPAIKQMADAMNTPEQRRMFLSFQKEFQRLGMMQEIQEESLADALSIDELSDVADAEVEKAIQDAVKGVTAGMVVPSGSSAGRVANPAYSSKGVVGMK